MFFFGINTLKNCVSADVAFTLGLVYLIFSINLHEDPSVSFTEPPTKLTETDFYKFLSGLNGGHNFPLDFLDEFYRNVANHRVETDTSEVRPFLASKTKCGWLIKEGGKRKTWKKRWIMANSDALMYFKKQEREVRQKAKY